MISNERFLDLAGCVLGRNLRDPANKAQLGALTHGADPILQIVAGPGSGKTTVLVLRALRHVFVEDNLPEHILITTFTRKAARELRTRWLDWGTALRDKLSGSYDLRRIDINRCRIDTLDSTVHDVLTEFRPPGTLAPALADATASLLILKRRIFQSMYWPNRQAIDPLLSRYTLDRQPPQNQGTALTTMKRLLERLVQDRVDSDRYSRVGDAQKIVVDMLREYRELCAESKVFDFATLEEHFLERLSDGHLNEWTSNLRVMLVDEYQDTNPLQEAIYFSLIRSAKLSTTIVGDDDQSMYRFRGGSVELFTNFADRCRRATGRHTRRLDMVRNFRSQPAVIDFFNGHISSDSEFQAARINPPKPAVTSSKPNANIPVLGMFRSDQETLATSLACFLRVLADRHSIVVGSSGQEIRLSGHGHVGDAVFLSHSVQEVGYDRFGRAPQSRFPGILRTALENCDLQVFNPRGRSLRSIPDVQKLLGLVILAVDPSGALIDAVQPTQESRFFLNRWRGTAEHFVASDPFPNDRRGLSGFIDDWQSVSSGQVVTGFPPDWPVLELIFKLITWIPEFQSQPEHQVWLEAITRVIASAGMASPYGMQLFQNASGISQDNHVRLSRQSLMRDALTAIALDEAQVDEDIMPSVPRDQLQFMTIHQAKGLEFPLVIVDVGSRFKMNHTTQRFLRFPDHISNVVQEEDDVEPYLAAPIRQHRGGLDRTFDDLVRLYYVAFSRPQSVLMLVGNEACLRYGPGRVIPNVALGWHRNQDWPWRQTYTTRMPPVKVEPPFWEM